MTNNLPSRLKAATCGSRELDAEIHRFLFQPKEGYRWDWSIGELSQVLWMRKPNAASIHVDFPRYTTSLDAALALVGECGQVVRYISWHRFSDDPPVVHATVGRERKSAKTGQHKEPAIAVILALIALLTALEADDG